ACIADWLAYGMGGRNAFTLKKGMEHFHSYIASDAVTTVQGNTCTIDIAACSTAQNQKQTIQILPGSPASCRDIL
ncbi:hypothetical protein L0N00_16890, partial [Eggerthella lenta]|nr:hypothetical protein [Eggerthella lenta]